MRRVLTRYLRAGDRVGLDVFARLDAPPLLRAGVRVSESYRTLLERAGITSIWVDDALSEGIQPLEVLSEETKQRAAAAIRGAYADASKSVNTGKMLPDDTVKQMAKVVEKIVKDVAGNVHAALALNDLANADGYSMKHSLAVTTLGLSLGFRVMQRHGWIDAVDNRRYDGIEERLFTLGVGLLVHDVGKLAVPADILQKPGPLTDDEWEIVKTHPLEGVRILQHATISPLTRAVVRSHHERWEGSGYPAGLSGEQIHQFARIAAVADVFDALASERHYRPAWTIHDAWNYIVERGGSDFDPQVVDIFKRSVAPFPPGTNVVLSDGSCGIVKEVKEDFVTQPIVRVAKNAAGDTVPLQDIDLSTTPSLTIVSTDCDLFSSPND